MTEDYVAKELTCAKPECRKVLQILKSRMRPLNTYIVSQGWRARGSVNGMLYFCDEHTPDYGGTKKRKPGDDRGFRR